jgi:hypothetical protein
LHAYDRVMNHTASQIAHGTMSKLHMDVDAGTETIESVVDLDWGEAHAIHGAQQGHCRVYLWHV